MKTYMDVLTRKLWLKRSVTVLLLISGGFGAYLFSSTGELSPEQTNTGDVDRTSLHPPLEKTSAVNLRTVSIQTPKSLATTHNELSVLKEVLELEPSSELRVLKEHVGQRGQLVRRVQQEYLGIPIWGEHLIVHTDKAGKLERLEGRVVDGLSASPLNVVPVLTNEQALGKLKKGQLQKLEIPLSAIATLNYQREKVGLTIFVEEGQEAKLAYHVDYFVAGPEIEPSRPNAIIDATNGRILKHWNALTNVSARGPGGNQRVGRYEYGVDFGFLDVIEYSPSWCRMENSKVVTSNHNNQLEGVPFEIVFFCLAGHNGIETNGGYSPSNDAHYFGTQTHDMFVNWLGAPPLISKISLGIRYGINEDNAFWDGASATFGDGGKKFHAFVGMGIVAHEISHGFTEQNSNLIYENQPGGLNESFSDLAGEALKYYIRGESDWLVGKDVKKKRGWLRNMKKPSKDRSSINHAGAYHDGLDVHHSSGVYNRAFYRLAQKEGWNARKVFEVAAVANRDYWGPNSTFDTAACGMLNAAQDFGYSVLDVYYALDSVRVQCITPPHIDLDGDSMSDLWELVYKLDPDDPSDAALDNDADGLTNLDEYNAGSDPLQADTDHDNLTDFEEVNVYGTSPASADTDSDEMPDDWEVTYGLDPLISGVGQDFDVDGVSDLGEYLIATDPSDNTSYPEETGLLWENFEDGAIPSLWVMPAGEAGKGWKIEKRYTVEGDKSLKSGKIKHKQLSAVEYTGRFSAGDLSFVFRVDSEQDFDFFEFDVDGEHGHIVSEAWSGDIYKRQITFPLSAGVHTLRWQYLKDRSVSRYTDAAYIDDVFFEDQSRDLDGDGMLNFWEIEHGLNPEDPADAVLDLDGDGLNNADEHANGSDPTDIDSDDDGIDDAYEVLYGDSPYHDGDNDGYSLFVEYSYGTSPIDGDDYPSVDHDFNSDGFADILWRSASSNYLWSISSGGTLNQFSGIAPLPTLEVAWSIAAVKDFDGDGEADILWRNGNTGENRIWVLDGVSYNAYTLPAQTAEWTLVGVGDFDGDGYQDIFWNNKDENAIWYLDGVTYRDTSPILTKEAKWKAKAVADFDGDGKSDVMWRHKGKNALWLMVSGVKEEVIMPSQPAAWKVVGAGDFNGDDRADVFWRKGKASLIWYMDGAIKVANQKLASISSSWKPMVLSDFDGDANVDVFWRNKKTGYNQIWLISPEEVIKKGVLQLETSWEPH